MGVTLAGVSLAIERTGILRDVSADIPSGSVTGLLGPNGAGKSTLLRLIAGIETPDAGEIRLDGTVVASLSRREAARRIALLEQSATPSVDLSVRDVVLLGRIPHRSRMLGSFGGDEDRRVAEDSLAMVGAAPFADRQWHTLSDSWALTSRWLVGSSSSSSACRSRGRWRRNRACCCSTNPPTIST